MKRFVPPPTEMTPEISLFFDILFNLAFALEMDWLMAISLVRVVFFVDKSNGTG
jgi:hypothetical protein